MWFQGDREVVGDIHHPGRPYTAHHLACTGTYSQHYSSGVIANDLTSVSRPEPYIGGFSGTCISNVDGLRKISGVPVSPWSYSGTTEQRTLWDQFIVSILERMSSSWRFITTGIAAFGTLRSVLYERLSLSQRVLYRRFHCIIICKARWHSPCIKTSIKSSWLQIHFYWYECDTGEQGLIITMALLLKKVDVMITRTW